MTIRIGRKDLDLQVALRVVLGGFYVGRRERDNDGESPSELKFIVSLRVTCANVSDLCM